VIPPRRVALFRLTYDPSDLNDEPAAKKRKLENESQSLNATQKLDSQASFADVLERLNMESGGDPGMWQFMVGVLRG
jgi:hypothetical protein